MSKLRVHNLAMSLDGYVAGPEQSVDDGLGVGGENLHTWMFETVGARRMIGEAGGEEGIDNDFSVRGTENIGATIMGRNMFGPIRGDWGDDEWKGWWGPNPPYHHPVFVLTHYPHAPIEMEGGTTFNFVTDGIEAALEQAVAAANGADVRLGGGASTVQQYLRAGLVDELHVPVVPVLLGSGERLFDNLDGAVDSYEVDFVGSQAVGHYRLVKKTS